MKENLYKIIQELALDIVNAVQDSGLTIGVENDKDYQELIKKLCKDTVDFAYDCRLNDMNKYSFKQMKDIIDELDINITFL